MTNVVTGLAFDFIAQGIWDEQDFAEFQDTVYRDGFRGGVQCYGGGFEDMAEIKRAIKRGELIID